MVDDRQRSTTLARVEYLFKQLEDAKDRDGSTKDSSSVREVGCLGGSNSKDRKLQSNYDLWREYIAANRDAFEEQYADDAQPVVFATVAKEQDVKMAVYRWASPNICRRPDEGEGIKRRKQYDGRVLIVDQSNWKPIKWSAAKGTIIFVHGITESPRYGLFATRALRKANIRYPFQTSELSKEEENTLMTFIKENGGGITYRNSWLETLVNENLVVYALDLQGHGLSEAWLGSRNNIEHFEYFIDDVLQVGKCK